MKEKKPIVLESQLASSQILYDLWDTQNKQIEYIKEYIDLGCSISEEMLQYLEKCLSNQVNAYKEMLEIQEHLLSKLLAGTVQKEDIIHRYELRLKEIPLKKEKRKFKGKEVLLMGLDCIALEAIKKYMQAEQYVVKMVPAFSDEQERKTFFQVQGNEYAGFVLMLNGECTYEYFKEVFLNVACMAGYLEAHIEEKHFVVGITMQDGVFGMSGSNQNVIQGSLSGVLKTLAKECRNCYVKMLDFATGLTKEDYQGFLEEEVHATDTCVEIARDQNGKRYTLSYVEVNEKESSKMHPQKEDVYVVSGGGRGITAECIIALSQQYGGNYIILGRTTLDENVYSEQMTRSELIDAIAQDEKKQGRKKKPSEIAHQAEQILWKREIRETLRYIERNGGRAVYCPCDITDKNTVKEVIKNAEKITGAVTGIIHGAGVIRDKKLSLKTEWDYQLVYATKVKGIENILNAVDQNKLKYISFFSSIAGCLGNIGQADYAAANEYLNKLAYALKRKNPECMVMSMNWGPWDGGMVNSALRKNMKEQGRNLIKKETGINYFLEQFSKKHGKQICQTVIFDSAP